WRCWCRPFCCDALGEFGGGAKRFAALHLVPAGVARLARAAEGLPVLGGALRSALLALRASGLGLPRLCAVPGPRGLRPAPGQGLLRPRRRVLRGAGARGDQAGAGAVRRGGLVGLQQGLLPAPGLALELRPGPGGGRPGLLEGFRVPGPPFAAGAAAGLVRLRAGWAAGALRLLASAAPGDFAEGHGGARAAVLGSHGQAGLRLGALVGSGCAGAAEQPAAAGAERAAGRLRVPASLLRAELRVSLGVLELGDVRLPAEGGDFGVVAGAGPLWPQQLPVSAGGAARLRVE
ncbi:unnamed protein product, partial [Effrenium voratum]